MRVIPTFVYLNGEKIEGMPFDLTDEESSSYRATFLAFASLFANWAKVKTYLSEIRLIADTDYDVTLPHWFLQCNGVITIEPDNSNSEPI